MILHIYRSDEGGWEACDERGKWRGVSPWLGSFRTSYEVPLHRGQHPDPDRRPPGMVELAAYWLEIERAP